MQTQDAMGNADSSRLTTLSRAEALEAAAFALVAERCRPSILHDIRGGLQAVNSAVELLARAAKNPAENSALAEKAISLARRALANHETSLLELLDQITPQPETPGTLNLGELVNSVLRFIRSDAANKSVSFRLATPPEVFVLAPAHKFRLLLLGLISTLTDRMEPASIVDVTVGVVDSFALIEFRAAIPSAPDPDLEHFLRSEDRALSLHELLLGLTRHWLCANGGRLELPHGSDPAGALRIYHPLK